MEDYPLKRCQSRLNSALRRGQMERAKKWIGRIDGTALGQVITEMEVENMTKLVGTQTLCKGQKRDYFYQKTVKSIEELDKYRFENYCFFLHSKPSQILKPVILLCSSKRRQGKTCDFKLMAVPANLPNGDIHVYAHSKHSDHPIQPAARRAIIRSEKELLPHANPPKIFCTADNIKWTFVQSFPDYDKLQQFRHKIQGQLQRTLEKEKRLVRIRYYCNRRRMDNCRFQWLALKTARQGYHVYQHGEHKHNNNRPDVLMPDKNPPRILHTADDIEWTFVQSFPDYDKLQEFRLRKECHLNRSIAKDKEALQTRYNCNRGRKRTNYCPFMLLARKTTTQGYHLYEHGNHNHYNYLANKSFDHNTNSLVLLMPDKNPPRIFHTADDIEWTFVQTFPDYDKLQKFRQKNKSHESAKRALQIRYSCNRSRKRSNYCPFMLLSRKTAKQRYHLYKHGNHNHLANKSIALEDEVEEEEDDEKVVGEEEEYDEEMEGEGEGEEKEDTEEDEEGKDIKLIVKVEKQEEDEEERLERLMEVKIIEIIEGNSREETLKKKLEKANEKVYKWMAGIEPNDIGQTIGDWDKLSLLKMVEMADQEIREHPQKLNLWLPWLKCAIPKSLPQIEGVRKGMEFKFNVRFKNLINLTYTKEE